MTTPVYDTVAYLASDRFAVSNAAGDSFASEFAPGLRLRADCGTDGMLLGTVTAASHDGETGRTVITTAMDGGVALTANLAGLLHGNDLPESLCAHAALHAPGGRDALPAASVGVSGLVSLAGAAETQAGTNAAKAVTPAGLAASAKGLIAANTTIYVATTGSDATGTGASGAPYASIAKALSSIAGKLIASGATVTIQVADGTYAISSAIGIDHPDADKMQILGNTSAETTVAISSIDTTAKTFKAAGNYVSNADATKNIQPGDIIGLTGSSTSGLNGAYVVSGVNYDGTNTAIACTGETLSSATVGGGSVVIKPCNRCVISGAPGITCFNVTRNTSFISGFRINASGGGSKGVLLDNAKCTVGTKVICHGTETGVQASNRAYGFIQGITFKGCAMPLAAYYSTLASNTQKTIFHGVTTRCVTAMFNSFVYLASSAIIMNSCATDYSPAVNADGNGNSQIQVS